MRISKLFLIIPLNVKYLIFPTKRAKVDIVSVNTYVPMFGAPRFINKH